MKNQTTPDRILDAAETESMRRPDQPPVPVGIEISEAATDALAAYETAYSAWVDTEAALAEAVEKYRQAERDDRAALEQAARKGKTAPPAPTAPDLLRAIEFTTLRTLHAREAANTAAAQANRALDADPDLMWRAMDAIQASNDQMRERLTEIRNLWAAEINRHHALMRNMPWVIKGARPEMSISDMRASWSPPQVRWPEPRDIDQVNLRELFTNIYNAKERANR